MRLMILLNGDFVPVATEGRILRRMRFMQARIPAPRDGIKLVWRRVLDRAMLRFSRWGR